MNIDPSILKAYDIRGLYPGQVNKEVAYSIGRGFSVFVKDFYKIKEPKIVVGYDIRKSSKELFEGITKALIGEGCRVIDIGLCSTPLNYFANWHLGVDGSVMITASHNPKDYNGLKLSFRGVMALAEVGGIEKLKELVSTAPAPPPPSSPSSSVSPPAAVPAATPPISATTAPPAVPRLGERGERGEIERGEIERGDVLNDYLDFLSERAEGIDFSKLKIAVDCSNGMVGPVFEKLAKRIGLNYQGLFMEPDGDFPNHEPNPLNEEAIKGLQALMKREKFDLGITFDGDGDRFVVLDTNGELIKTDFLIGLFAQYYLSKEKSKKIPCDHRLSRGVREIIQEVGGEVIKSKVGYPHLRKIMREERTFFGGELSGHFFWQDFSYSESGLLSMLRLLKILREKNQPIEKLVEPMKRYFNSGELNFEVEDKVAAIKKIEKAFSDGDISKLDGLTVEYQDWWFNVRPSNTEPLLRLIIEASSEGLLRRKIKEIKGLITK